MLHFGEQFHLDDFECNFGNDLCACFAQRRMNSNSRLSKLCVNIFTALFLYGLNANRRIYGYIYIWIEWSALFLRAAFTVHRMQWQRNEIG